MALGSTLPPTEMSTRNIFWGGQGGQCIGLTLPPSCAECLEILVAPTSWNPQGMSRPVQGLLYLFHLTSRLILLYSKHLSQIKTVKIVTNPGTTVIVHT
jgi:hypothetical protein